MFQMSPINPSLRCGLRFAVLGCLGWQLLGDNKWTTACLQRCNASEWRRWREAVARDDLRLLFTPCCPRTPHVGHHVSRAGRASYTTQPGSASGMKQRATRDEIDRDSSADRRSLPRHRRLLNQQHLLRFTSTCNYILVHIPRMRGSCMHCMSPLLPHHLIPGELMSSHTQC